MQMYTRILGIFGGALIFSGASLLGLGCGDETTESSSSSSSGGATSSSSSSSSSSGGSSAIHGCEQATAKDETASAALTINFAGLAYTPKCVRVKAGTVVTFSGDFTMHPLVGGEVSETGTKTPDANSPIVETSAGMSAMFTMSTAGTFPFYCDIHAITGMTGVIFVE